MAFYKRCEGTVAKCSKCNNPGMLRIANEWFCHECAEKKSKSEKKSKKKQKIN